MRVCENCKGIDLNGFEKHNGKSNGMNGVGVSKKGNLVKPKAFTSTGNYGGFPIIIQSAENSVANLVEVINQDIIDKVAK